MNRVSGIVAILAIMSLALMDSASARVKLVTLPDRDVVGIMLDNPNYTLVTEERVVTLQAGINQIDFSWQGVSIDPASIQFEILWHKDKVKMLNVSYPPDENALVWEVYSPEAMEERIRIYYLMGGFNRVVSYRAVTDQKEKQAVLESYFRLSNQSGEDFADAQIRAGYGAEWVKDLRNGETREMLSFQNPALPLKKLYVYTPAVDDKKVPMYYEVRNEAESGLGQFKLPGGKVRIFQRDSSGATIFLGEDWMQDTPVKEKRELYLGVARDVVVKRSIMRDERDRVVRNNDKNVVLFDRIVQIQYEIENFKKDPVELKIVETVPDYWRIEELAGPNVRHEKKDAQTLEIFVALPPKGEKQVVNFVYKQLNQLP
jgi:hypothetical protein